METPIETNNEQTPKKSKKIGRLPTKAENLKTLATHVLTAWKQSNLTLLWKTTEDFEQEIIQFDTQLGNKALESGSKKPLVNDLNKLDKEINKGVEHIKKNLQLIKEEEDYKASLEQFGIQKLNQRYSFPNDRDARLRSLQLMIDALGKSGMTLQKYPLTFWQETLQKYGEMTTQVQQAKGKITGMVKNKDNVQAEIRKTLVSIGKLIEANYPDDYDKVLREWGFQKENY
jgi:hypothetical protein